MNPKDRQHLENLRDIHLKQLRILKQQSENFGPYVPAFITGEIERRKEELADIERQLGLKPSVSPAEGAGPTNTAQTSVGPATSSPIELFFSYARADETLRDELAIHLRSLEREKVIAGWHDRKISPGTEWAGQIDAHLNSARIILLLVSPHFIASDYINDVELRRALERHDAGEVRVVPVILRPVDWHSTPFAKLQALPRDAKPVTTWRNRDEAFLDVANGIRQIAEKLKGS